MLRLLRYILGVSDITLRGSEFKSDGGRSYFASAPPPPPGLVQAAGSNPPSVTCGSKVSSDLKACFFAMLLDLSQVCQPVVNCGIWQLVCEFSSLSFQRDRVRALHLQLGAEPRSS